jgi:hypothetical protein
LDRDTSFVFVTSEQYIVTDDRRDLLPLKVIRVAGYKPVQIVAPRAFLKSVLGVR